MSPVSVSPNFKLVSEFETSIGSGPVWLRPQVPPLRQGSLLNTVRAHSLCFFGMNEAEGVISTLGGFSETSSFI
jgi:hypothetical protein